MKAEVTNLAKENVGGENPGKRLVVTCTAPEGSSDNALRHLAFTVPYTTENLAKYAFGTVIDVTV